MPKVSCPVKEVSDIAYDKAVEVVTDIVQQETQRGSLAGGGNKKLSTLARTESSAKRA